ncbi:MAG: glycosyltransferase [Planctomycetales bacterium]|nr:glycosyltransferase [Planctomycetales bacterium]
MKKLLIINNVPTPYREFMFTKMSDIGRTFGIDVTVAFQAEREPGRPWKADDFSYSFRHYFSTGMAGKDRRHMYSYGVINRDILHDLACGGYTWAFFSPFMSITNWMAAFLPTRTRKVLWSESNLQSTKHVDPIARFLKSRAIKQFDALACPGIRAVEYLTFLRPSADLMPRLRLPNIVDTNKFLNKVLDFKSQRQQFREKLNIAKDTICVFAIGRFIEIKGFKKVLNVLKNLEGNYLFCLAGDGPERPDYENIILQDRLQNRVRLLGQISEDEVVQWLSISDWFFHPAQKDPSPLVVIEAVNAGMPMAVSLQTGNCPEAVDEGQNGFVFDAYADGQIVETLQKMLTVSSDERTEMSQRSLQKAKDLFNPDIVLDAFYKKLLEFSN